ncbi:ribosome hibernation factor-recruiting GTPase MRF [Nocardia sp. NBC_01329]|uniref:ribosome hibernation factor-recruiting GTPase MRF n=1 Tax=Nocardia sp. NBC_01329 TaxID=2903594 RepID=UPI002E167084|nr:GTP-binding protein [Nocardia sp. NBC_01329]
MSHSAQLPEDIGPGDRRTPVVVVAGLHGDPGGSVDLVAEALGAAPDTVVVRHDLSGLGEGIVRRTVRHGGKTTVSIHELAHGCVSCTLKADLLPLLCTLAARDSVHRIVLALDPAVEAESVCRGIAEVVVAGVVGRVDGPAARDVRVGAVLTGIDARTWLAAATGDEALDELGWAWADDDRTIAQLAVGQVDFADALVVTGSDAVDPLERARLGAVLSRLNPRAPALWAGADTTVTPDAVENLLMRIPAGSRRGRDFDAHAPLLRGQPPLAPECGVELVEFASRRPFHPDRLHDALDVLFEGVVTARGRVWLATQPDEVVWLESAGGGLRIGGAGRWLAAMTEAERAEVEPERAAMAGLRWDDRFGDRDNSLVVLVHTADPDEIRAALEQALVDDAELRLVERAPGQVARWPDPFGEWHTDPCVPEEPHPAATGEGRGGDTGESARKEK